jgi:beta-N-acetylhexosaminidase
LGRLNEREKAKEGVGTLNTALEPSEIESKIGQLFMAGLPGTHLDEGTRALIEDYRLGGIILFSRNIENPLQLAQLCRNLQEKAIRSQGHPLFLAVDQEGGSVARLREPFTRFPGNAAIGTDPEPIEKALQFGRITAREMKLVGLNMNLAPVLDVQRGELEKHLAGRTFGEDPQKTASLGRVVVKSLQENGVMAVAKHFPGLGRADLDPHFHLPRIDIDVEEIQETNLPPFMAAIDEGVSAIMTSHAIYAAMDSERPATLSPTILNGFLREKMAFDGLIVTDDLEMGAIAEHWGVAEGASEAFEAGADILLICKDQKNVFESINLLKRKFMRREMPLERLDLSNQRIIKAKSKFLSQAEEVSLKRVKEYFKL